MAKTRTLEVVISGDASQLNRAFKSVDSEGKKVESRAHGIKTAMGLLGGAAAGVALVGLKASTDAATEAATSQARLQAQLKASGISYKDHAKEIDNVVQKTSKLAALDDEDVQDAFTNLVRATGSVSKSMNLVGLAADIARAKHMDVGKAAELVGKVANGNTGILKRYGVQIDKGATSTEALGKLQDKFKGQAKAYGDTTAGAQDRIKVSTENLEEAVGKNLTPTLGRLANKFADLINWFGKGSASAKIVAGAIGTLAAALGIAAVINRVASAVRALRSAMLLLNASFLANPIVLVTAAIVAVGAALVVAYKKSDTFRRIVNGVFRSVRDFVVGAIDKILGGVSSFLSGVSKVARALGRDGLANKAQAGADAIDGLRESLRKVPGHKDVDVNVKIKLGGQDVDVSDAKPLSPNPPSGEGIGRAIDSAVRGSASVKRAASRVSSLIPAAGAPSSGLMGANSSLAPFAAIGSRFGLRVSSGRRPGSITSSGNVSYHSTGEAIDMADGRGPDAQKLGFFKYMKANFGSRLAELIYTPGGAGIKDGHAFTYSGQVAADHYDHVHVAYDTGKPGVGDGIGDATRLARQAGFKGQGLVTALAVSGAESGWRSHASNRNTDGSIDRGYWQINSVHGALSTFDPLGNARAAFKISSGGTNWRPWVTFQTGAYRRYLGQARAAATAGGSTGGTTTSSAGATRASGPLTGKLVSTGSKPPTAADVQSQVVADADLAISGADASGNVQAQIAANTQKAGVIDARIAKVQAALRKRTLRPATRLRLTQELAQLTSDRSSITSRIAELRTPVDSGADPNQALIDSNNALAQAMADAAEAAREQSDLLNGVKAELKRQTDVATTIQSTEAFQLKKYLADVLSGQIGGYGVAPRSFTPGTGVAHAY